MICYNCEGKFEPHHAVRRHIRDGAVWYCKPCDKEAAAPFKLIDRIMGDV